MSIDNDIATLEQVPMLNMLGQGALRLIAMGAETRQVMPGDVLFRPGENVDCAYVVQQGSFQLSAEPGASDRAIEAGPGTMLGEFALITETAHPLSATAQEESTVLRISRSMFMKILEDDANAAVRLRDYVVRRTRQSVADMLRVRDVLDMERGG